MIKQIKVREYTHFDLTTADKNTPVSEIEIKMKEGGFRHIPIIEDEKIIGIVSERDIQIAMKVYLCGLELSAYEVMTKEPYTVTSDTPLKNVVSEILKNKFGSAVVFDEKTGKYGIFTTTDALAALFSQL